MKKLATPGDLETALAAVMVLNRQGATREQLSDNLSELASRVASGTRIAMTYNLEDMARQMVGDGKAPNMFFATDDKGKVLAVIGSSKTDAIKVGKAIGAYLVEDRKHGEVWGSPAYEKKQSSPDDE